MTEKKSSWKNKFNKIKDTLGKIWTPKIFKSNEGDSTLKKIAKGFAIGAWRGCLAVGSVCAVGQVAPMAAGAMVLGGLGYLYIDGEIRAKKAELAAQNVLSGVENKKGGKTRSNIRDSRGDMLNRLQSRKNTNEFTDTLIPEKQVEKKSVKPYKLSDNELSKFVVGGRTGRR